MQRNVMIKIFNVPDMNYMKVSLLSAEVDIAHKYVSLVKEFIYIST